MGSTEKEGTSDGGVCSSDTEGTLVGMTDTWTVLDVGSSRPRWFSSHANATTWREKQSA